MNLQAEDFISDIKSKFGKFINLEHKLSSILFYHETSRFIKSNLTLDSIKVLDIGCSYGYGIHLMKQFCNTKKDCYFVGVDIDSQAVSTAFETLKDQFNEDIFSILNLDMTKKESANTLIETFGKFDVVTCFEVFEHIPPSKSSSLLRNVHDLLKPGGLLFISTPNKEIYDIDAYTEDHINEVPAEDFIRKIKDAGFDILYVYGSHRISPLLIGVLSKFGLAARVGDKKNELPLHKKLFRLILVSIISPTRTLEFFLKLISFRRYLLFRLRRARLTPDYKNSALIFIIAKKQATP